MWKLRHAGRNTAIQRVIEGCPDYLVPNFNQDPTSTETYPMTFSWSKFRDQEIKPDWQELFGEEQWNDEDAWQYSHHATNWLSPHVAFMLFDAALAFAGGTRKGAVSRGKLPVTLLPFADNKVWRTEYRNCARRIVLRLSLGAPPAPNCTGEEVVLYHIIQLAQQRHADGQYDLTRFGNPASVDEEFERVRIFAFEDQDVLLLYKYPGLIHSCGITQHFHMANLHPCAWFEAFKDDHIDFA